MSQVSIPNKLKELIDDFGLIQDKTERTEMLIYYADAFDEVPENIATRPFDEKYKVPACESQAYVWSKDNPDGTLKYYFAVENPQGISAKAMAAILDETVSGAPLEEIVNIDVEVIYKFFGNKISMGRDVGLRSLVKMVKSHALQKLNHDT